MISVVYRRMISLDNSCDKSEDKYTGQQRIKAFMGGMVLPRPAHLVSSTDVQIAKWRTIPLEDSEDSLVGSW